ncbi:transcriptional regulator, TetR family [Streptomyces sp. 1222.5]|uniref:ScbR family autoregulator-binding transcription factor n=1 Tax=unclassified Streptomyces TaxID=2593676 RepID=UPI0008980404|nr:MULTISPECIES: ScbR family autoregulator-binding transcription factor [unclassified Streptomyces]PKW05239.1 TetR family transcriptional regulator [Streptomyces sp. 5112.2]SEC07534.1 transcriptional regulator, TetR family [Streptomyces sp. 2231.1]SED46193.1 transcriptional regulator, TetR family [Streptomyces sp. 1222.5]
MPEPHVNAFAPWRTPSRRGSDPKQERSVLTRLRVLRGAAELFTERGYRQTSVKDVADRVEMTKGAVYFHYPTKEALALAIVDEHYARWPKILDEVIKEGLGPVDAAARMLERAAVAFQDDVIVQAGARLQLERPQIEAELPTPYVDWISLLESLLVSAQEAGELRPGVEPGPAARSLVSAFFGSQHVSDVLSGRADVVRRWRDLSDLLFRAIRAD